MEYIHSFRHILVKFFNCNHNILSNRKLLDLYTREAAKELNIGEIKNSFFLFNPYGITVVVVLNKCQLTLNTNYNNTCTTLDLFTISADINSYSAFKYLNKTLKAKTCEINEIMHNENSLLFPYIELPINSKINLRCNSSYINPTISILGSSGGVAKSVLSILNKACKDKTDPINSFINSCKLHLIDLKQNDMKYYENRFPNLKNKISLYEFDLNNTEVFTEHLKQTNTTIVLDVSFADTVNMLRCCDSLGVIYINSAFESLSVDENNDLEGFPLQERYEIFESHRDEFQNTSAIICSGMNPGVVQWMAIDLMKKYPNKLPKACYIVEEDTSFYEDETLADKNTLYTTWSTECFLDEAIYSYPSFVKKHHSLFLYKDVYELEFKVVLGEKNFYGCLMPHEEAITLGKMYDMETGFIYKINDHTTNLITDNLDNVDDLWSKPMSVLNPEVSPLKGEDLVGILLVYDDKELYMYNSLNNSKTYEKYKTNATYLQVAAGIYGALATILLDNIPRGIYYVDELLVNAKSNYGKYLKHHLDKFVIGENNHSDGDLLDRMRERKK
ncbi:S-adenosylmethionine decarboxylase [Clostridium sp.]|uniref:S-adenosylmethionine decarboxylase n=1 Tax=Clostridium sp. TaxID=1506 RepID=UPI0028462B7E|nr:S-adenosylmethionine decarboxylase [Clostridium sp.]MDR3597507.1 S-adenosylmethionine decarboxylase [Clostridium sp.]